MTTKPLSPAAQAVETAVLKIASAPGNERRRIIAAAAIRELADLVVPSDMCSARTDRGLQRTLIRNEILRIAAELEGTP